MPLTLPYTIAPHSKILSVPLQANFQSIIDKFSGGLVNADFSTLCAFDGAKMAVNSMPGDRIATGTLTKAQMGAASVDNAQLVALAVTKDKLSTTAGQKITQAQMTLGSFLTTGVALNTGSLLKLANIACDIGTTVLVGGVASLTVRWNAVLVVRSGATEPSAVPVTGLLTPVAAIPSASNLALGAVIKNLSGFTDAITFDVELLYLAKS